MIDDVWKKWSVWASAILTTAWAALAGVWAVTSLETQAAVMARFGLDGLSSGEVGFYIAAAAAVSTAVIGAVRVIKQAPPEAGT